MLRASVCVNGRARLHHCVQFVMNDIRYVEARGTSPLFIMVGNSHSVDIDISFSTENCRLPTNHIHLQENQKIAIPIDYQGGLSSITLVTPFDNIVLGLGSGEDLKAEGVNFLWLDLPSAFPADHKRYHGKSELDCEMWFHRMQATSRFEIESPRKRATSKTDDAAGYVYLLTHPVFSGWVKVGCAVDMQEQARSYQNSDPLRRFEMRYFAYVDNRHSFEQFILHRARETFRVENEWVEGDLQLVGKLFEETLGLMKGSE